MPLGKADRHDSCQIKARGLWQMVVVTRRVRMGKEMTSLRATQLEKSRQEKLFVSTCKIL